MISGGRRRLDHRRRRHSAGRGTSRAAWLRSPRREVIGGGGAITLSGLALRDGYASEYGGAILNNSTALSLGKA